MPDSPAGSTVSSDPAADAQATDAAHATADPNALFGTKGRWLHLSETTDAANGNAATSTTKPGGRRSLFDQLLAQRGLDDPTLADAFLNPKLSDLNDPAELPGCVAAAEAIVAAIDANRKVIVYGDYDVDGVTASAILWHTIRACHGHVETYVPHRLEEGYGLNTESLLALLKASPDALIVSVDCGITAVDQAKAVAEAGGELIITDHHHLDPDNLPQCAGLVHPELPIDGKIPVDPTPLCGAGVALKLAWQIARVRCGSDRLPDTLKTLMVDLLPLAALGTVADVVPLVGENRVLTFFGLARIKNTPWTGLNALIDAAELRAEKVSAYHVGFVLGPRLNAVGRLGHAAEAVELLTKANEHEAHAIAHGLTQINEQRRRTEKRIFDEAVEQIETHQLAAPGRRALVLIPPPPEAPAGKAAKAPATTLPTTASATPLPTSGGGASGGGASGGGASGGWHPGVIGIVASRLVERYHRPVVMLSRATDADGTELAKGSARSVPGVSIVEAFNACSGHLLTHGGHAMAAGLKLKACEVDAFREALVEHVNGQLREDQLHGQVVFDAEAELQDCCLGFCQQLERLGPFGASNPSPKFLLRGLKLQRPAQVIGQNGKHLRLLLMDANGNDHVQPAVAFGFGDWAPKLMGGVHVDLVAEFKINEFRGLRKADLHVTDLRLA